MVLRILWLNVLFCANFALAQDSSWYGKPDIVLSGFMDTYYAWDFNEPINGFRQSFLYNHNRHNEFNLNLGFIKVALKHKRYRSNFALQAGTYANDNYASEPVTLKHIFEANAGLALDKKQRFWIDIGIFPSHIGFESAISSDNKTLTRSILAENSPYFLSGAKFSFQPNEKWQVTALMCNGWQRITRVQGNSMPGFGTQLNYTPTEKIQLNWSTFIGTDDPDSTRRFRYFSNLYGQFQITSKLGFIAGFDIGLQQQAKGSSNYDVWYSPVAILDYQLTKTWSIAARVEYYRDIAGVIIPAVSGNEFTTTGYSLNLDFTPVSYIKWRIEGRWLHCKNDIFPSNNNLTNDNIFIVTSVSLNFKNELETR